MLGNLRIKGFRKYKDFSIDGFAPINFILGDNNVGKTSILEAVFAWACGQNVAPFMSIPLARGRYSYIQQPYWIMEEILSTVNDRKALPLRMSFEGKYNEEEIIFNHSIFPSELLSDYDTSYKNSTGLVNMRGQASMSGEMQQFLPGLIQIPPTTIAKWEVECKGNTVSSEIVLPFSQVPVIKPFCQAKYIDVLSQTSVNENVQIYASLKREKLLDEISREIGKVFPEVVGFDMIPYPDGSQSSISVIKKDSILPLYACGDGIQRWFYILGALSLYKHSIICIDEIDTGFHHAAQADFSANLTRGSMVNNTQLFITTHNLEFLDTFLEAVRDQCREYMEKIRVITLRDTADGQRIRSMAAEEALISRERYNLELR